MKHSKTYSKHMGFTMIEAMVALSLFAFNATLLSSCLKILVRSDYVDEALADEISLWQMRELLAECEEIEVNEKIISFIYHDDAGSLEIEKGRVVHKGGYEIMMMHLKNAYFLEENHEIYLIYEKDTKQKALLAYH